jgi:Tfp pilus assembly protein PilV
MKIFNGSTDGGFTILEVLIAMAIFFMASFTILHLTSQNLASARMLQRPPLDMNSLISDLFMTNQVEVGEQSGDFGELFPGVVWNRTITEVSTNGLFQVDVTVIEPGRRQAIEHTASLFLYRPESLTGPLSRFRR